mmetsp:Transcript_14606/g.57351  ORF Transcript_14606/g.57351 Transcript_14606/m.57351 type:complete len:301 (-) Transcript_14606:56-958(-)
MSYVLKPTYGKQSVPVFKIEKLGDKHTIIDMVVKIMLEGEIKDSWLTGENHQIVPTETQKNTCYALALQNDFDCLETYGLALARDMLARHSHLQTVNLDMLERVWSRVEVQGKPHNHVFSSSANPIKRSCTMTVSRDSVKVSSGMKDIKLLKTTKSGFAGYIEDQYTNLKPVGAPGTSPDRILATELEASWTYNKIPSVGFKNRNEAIFQRLVETFSGPADTGVFSKSLQETAYKMAVSVLRSFEDVDEVSLITPNIHNYTYPLSQFGLNNDNVVFQSTDCHSTASGRIETVVRRPSARL